VSAHLLQLGFVLIVLGLLTGLIVQKTANPRMALSSHLEGIFNGLLLVVLGLVWSRLDLGHTWLVTTFWLSVYSAYANWLVTLLAAIWNAGRLMPIAAPGRQGTATRERVINGLLATLSIAIIAACVIIVVGLS